MEVISYYSGPMNEVCPYKENEEESLDIDTWEDRHVTVEAEGGAEVVASHRAQLHKQCWYRKVGCFAFPWLS